MVMKANRKSKHFKKPSATQGKTFPCAHPCQYCKYCKHATLQLLFILAKYMPWHFAYIGFLQSVTVFFLSSISLIFSRKSKGN